MVIFAFVLCGIQVLVTATNPESRWLQDSGGDTDGVVQPATAPIATDDDHLRQIQTCREGIVDPRARPEERRRWAELLLSYETAEAGSLVVELLNLTNRPDVLRTICSAIAERGRLHPEKLSPSFVKPLIAMLGAENEELRGAAVAALGEYTGELVSAELAAIAGQTDAPMAKRLAAVDVLAANTHRRSVVGQLIRLLDLDVAEITARVTSVLDPLAARPIGPDKAAWATWWEQQSKLGGEVWLAEQLQVYRARERKLASEFETFRNDMERDATATMGRMRDFQREVLRSLNPDQRDARLVEWLADPLPVIRMAALSIVRARIADEGKRPDGEVLAALLRMLPDGLAVVRREVVQIVQNLNDPAVVDAVILRLTDEKDPATRISVFQAIGKMGNPRAIPALVSEIADQRSRADFVREAALALGAISAKLEVKSVVLPAVEPLKSRFARTPVDKSGLRGALLTAMAGVADPSFMPDFLTAMESEDPGLLQPAIRGLSAIGDASKKPRFRTLASHSDPRVRLAAVEALGKLGREDADLEPLLTRLNPSIESNEIVRDAAWKAFHDALAQRSLQDRLRAADRLRDMPDLEAKYLANLITSFASSDETNPELDESRDRLAGILVGVGRHAEAVPYLRDLYESASRDHSDATAIGIRWLEAVLHSPTHQGVAAVVERLGEAAPDEARKSAIVDAVSRYFESAEALADAERARQLIFDLRSVPADDFGGRWKSSLSEWSARFDVPANGQEKSPG